jgi:hypothetical protein
MSEKTPAPALTPQRYPSVKKTSLSGLHSFYNFPNNSLKTLKKFKMTVKNNMVSEMRSEITNVTIRV